MIKFLYKLSLTSVIILGLCCCNTVKSDESDYAIHLNDTLSKTSNTILNDSANSTYEPILSDNQPEEDYIQSISEIYKRSRKKATVFMIDPTRDTVLKCKEGTLISLPANSFERVNNQSLVDGNIKLSVKEYYSVSDILLANLTTRSNGNVIETGGMFLISAYAKDNNDSLIIKKDKKITIALPTSQNKNTDGMQLFNGVHDSDEVNWQPQSGIVTFAQRWSLGRDKMAINYNNSLVFPDTEPKKTPTLIGSLKQNYEAEILIPVRDYIQNSSVNARSAFGYIDTLGVLHGYLTSYKKHGFIFETNYTQTFSENIKTNVAVTFKVRMSFKDNFNKGYFDKLFKMGKGNPDSLVAVILTFVPHIRKTNYENIIRVSKDAINVSKYKKILKENKFKQLAYEKQVKLLENNALSNINNAQEYLLLSTQKLGWINCDKFNNSVNKTDYIVKLNEKTNVLIVFNDIKSIIPSDNEGVFRDVPLNEKITIVALKTQQGKIMLAMHETYISNKPFENLQFKAVSINEYKSKLQKLNSL